MIYPSYITKKTSGLISKVYTFFVKSRFKELETNISPFVEITNPKNIEIGKGTSIRNHTWLYAITGSNGKKNKFNPRLIIKERCSIGRFCHITCSNHVELGNDVFLTEGVLITDSIHGYKDIGTPVLLQPLISKGPIIIGDGTWIGNGARIVGKVKIGKGCVVAANSLVSNDNFPDYCVIMGIPAQIVKQYNFESNSWEIIN